ncbi:MAG: ATP-binding protein [Prevotella sp.]
MSELTIYEKIDAYSENLKLDFSGRELAALASDHHYTKEQLQAVIEIFGHLSDKKHETVINTLLKMSRLPMKEPKTFEGYDFTRLHGDDIQALKSLTSLSDVNAGRNIAFVGPAGVGKTHLAEAYGRACCMQRMKTYFLKASELNDKFTAARKYGHEAHVIQSLVKPTCLIIDEIGRCSFCHENTAMFFDLVDRRYEKEGPHTIIFTSNKQPNEWAEYFDGNDDLMCSLDRIFDKASIFNIKGESYRGRACTTYAVEAGEVSAPVLET